MRGKGGVDMSPEVEGWGGEMWLVEEGEGGGGGGSVWFRKITLCVVVLDEAASKTKSS